MPVGLIDDMRDTMPAGARLLGLDVGAKTIGLALYEPQGAVITPLKTLARAKFTRDMEALAAIVKDYEAGGFVIGLPLERDGSEGRRCQSVRDFAAEMQRHFPGAWIALADERFSTAAAEDSAASVTGFNRRQAKDRGVTDQLAAARILEGIF